MIRHYVSADGMVISDHRHNADVRKLRRLALPERALVGPARGSGWWQRAGHEVTVDVAGDAPALAEGDVPPSVEGQQPAARQCSGDGHGVLFVSA